MDAFHSPFGGSIEVPLAGESGFHGSALVLVVFFGGSHDVFGSGWDVFFDGFGSFFPFAFFLRWGCAVACGVWIGVRRVASSRSVLSIPFPVFLLLPSPFVFVVVDPFSSGLSFRPPSTRILLSFDPLGVGVGVPIVSLT